MLVADPVVSGETDLGGECDLVAGGHRSGGLVAVRTMQSQQAEVQGRELDAQARVRSLGRRRPSVFQPPSGRSLLDLLRLTGSRRPVADPELRSHLRSLLEEAAAPGAPDGAVGGAELLVVTKERLTRALACEAHAAESADRCGRPSLALACGAIVDALFRQLVTTGALGDPMGDGLAALQLDPGQRELVSWIGQLPTTDHEELRVEVCRQAECLARRWPRLDPMWLPRTQEVIRTSLGRGWVQLVARVDLAIGRPGETEASVAIVEIKTGARRTEHRADQQFAALIETLRRPAPPFAVATYYTRTGEVIVDRVTEDLLITAAQRTGAGLRVLLANGDRQNVADGDRRVSLHLDRAAPQACCAACRAERVWSPGCTPVSALSTPTGSASLSPAPLRRDR